MLYLVVVFVSLALLLAVVTLRKEQRLRIALEELLRRLLARWRAQGTRVTNEPAGPDPGDPGDDRMQQG